MNLLADTITMPAHMVPQFLLMEALEKNKIKNILFKTTGGIGDEICAEPTIRYAMKTYPKDCKFSIATRRPELFQHLNPEWIFNLTKEPGRDFSEYFVLDTFLNPGHLFWEYCCHMAMHCVDFSSICALRCQLPPMDREIILVPTTPKSKIEFQKRHCIIHPGKHWESKTFPIEWWDQIIETIRQAGIMPVLIGADVDETNGTVFVDSEDCIDLRNKTSLNDSIYYLQRAPCVLTNDSFPLHAASSGDAFIGFLSTAKPGHTVTHWRNGHFGLRMRDFAKGNVLEHIGLFPTKEPLRIDLIEEAVLRSWLPDPNEVAEWAISSINQF